MRRAPQRIAFVDESGECTGVREALVKAGFDLVPPSDGDAELVVRVSSASPSEAEQPASRRAAAPSVTTPERAPRILLVEDEDALRRTMHKRLERAGYHAHHASSAEDALSVIDELGTIDLLVTDIGLPGMSGARLAALLRARFGALRVLYMSASTREEVFEDAIADAATPFLQKPYPLQILVDRVEALVGPPPTTRRPA